MHFCPKPAGDESVAARMRALHLSLNTPVVALDDFPVGPARAGVVLSEAFDGRMQLEIAVRSVRTGQLRCYCGDEQIAAGTATAPAVEAALLFAEGMGFLFDEDEVATRGAEGERDAAALWRELVGDLPDAIPPAVSLRPTLSKFRLRLGAIEAEPAEADPVARPRRKLGAAGTAVAIRNRLLSRF